jgi:hypothetical protein
MGASSESQTARTGPPPLVVPAHGSCAVTLDRREVVAANAAVGAGARERDEPTASLALRESYLRKMSQGARYSESYLFPIYV